MGSPTPLPTDPPPPRGADLGSDAYNDTLSKLARRIAFPRLPGRFGPIWARSLSVQTKNWFQSPDPVFRSFTRIFGQHRFKIGTRLLARGPKGYWHCSSTLVSFCLDTLMGPQSSRGSRSFLHLGYTLGPRYSRGPVHTLEPGMLRANERSVEQTGSNRICLKRSGEKAASEGREGRRAETRGVDTAVEKV